MSDEGRETSLSTVISSFISKLQKFSGGEAKVSFQPFSGVHYTFLESVRFLCRAAACNRA